MHWDKDSVSAVIVGKPSIVGYKTSDPLRKLAVERIQQYLVNYEKDTDVGLFYIDSIENKQDTILVVVNHYDYYVESDKMKKEIARISKLEDSGDSAIELLYMPPSGNWSGKDRSILYLVQKDSIIDILYQ